MKGKATLLSLDYEKNLKILESFKKNDVVLLLGNTISKECKKLLETYKDSGLNTIFIGERLKSEDRNLLDVDLDISLEISENFFLYSLLVGGILSFV